MGIVLIGGGTCSVSAAERLRQEGYEGKITIVGEENDLPYQRPPLSKQYLAGEWSIDRLYLRPRNWYSDHQVEYLGGTKAIRIDASAQRVLLSDGASLSYEKALIATGGHPRRMDHPADCRIFYLRTLADADKIRSVLVQGSHVCILGGGFIGSEIASACGAMGVGVTVIEACSVPMERALGKAVGETLLDIHRGHGVQFELHSTVSSVETAQSGIRLKISSGKTIECDALIIGIGLCANVTFLEGSGVLCENGVSADPFCRTNVPHVLAAGDVASFHHPIFRRSMRVEHHDHAIQHGAAAAMTMVGKGIPYEAIPWVWSDQYDLNIQFAGTTLGASQEVFRGAPNGGPLTIFYLRDGIIQGALGINTGRDIALARKLIGNRAQVNPGALADLGTRIKDAVRIPQQQV